MLEHPTMRLQTTTKLYSKFRPWRRVTMIVTVRRLNPFVFAKEYDTRVESL